MGFGLDHVFADEGQKIVFRHVLILNDTGCLTVDTPLEVVTNETRICEVFGLSVNHAAEISLCHGSGIRGQNVVCLLAHVLEDLHQLAGFIIREVDILVETGTKTRVGLDEFHHFLGVSGNDDDEVITVVLHTLQQCVDSFLSVVA